MRRTTPALLLVLALVAGGPVASAGEDETPVELPLTIDLVWYRAGSQQALGEVFQSPGDLTITREGLEFVTHKKTLWFPLDQIRQVTFGKLKGDVDTDWAVLATGTVSPQEVFGFRDGRKLGYGARTREIYETLKRVARQLGAAQYAVPPGFEPFEGMQSQLFMAIPAGWDPYLESLSVGEDRPPWGTIIVSSEPIPRGDGSSAVLRRIRDGEVPAFIVERSEAGSGMRCEGLSKTARKRIGKRVSSHPILDREYERSGDAAVEPASVGGCEGIRAVVRGRQRNGREIVIDVVAVAREQTLFLFGVWSRPEDQAAQRDRLDAILGTVQFTVAR